MSADNEIAIFRTLKGEYLVSHISSSASVSCFYDYKEELGSLVRGWFPKVKPDWSTFKTFFPKNEGFNNYESANEYAKSLLKNLGWVEYGITYYEECII